MKILFAQFGTKYCKDESGNIYSDGSLNDKTWARYLSLSNDFSIIGRKSNNFEVDHTKTKKLNKIPKNINVCLIEDIFNPKKNFFNLKLRRYIKEIIKREINNNDFIIVKSLTNYYNQYISKYCLKNNKNFVVEITGFGFESYWYHSSILGKILAIITELKMKNIIKKCPNVLYVTNKTFQDRYKNKNNTIGCSDVEIDNNITDLNDRIKKINNNKSNKLVIGTIGNIDTKLKGQHNVIKALYILKNKYKLEFEYQLVGRGDNTYINNLIKKLNLEENVKILGEKSHTDVMNWLKSIDIYIHPSYTEGLCRSIIEAQSKACLVMSTNVGGNIELVNKNYLFKKHDYNKIVNILKNITKKDLEIEAHKNFELSKKFDKKILDKTRNDFYIKSISLEKFSK